VGGEARSGNEELIKVVGWGCSGLMRQVFDRGRACFVRERGGGRGKEERGGKVVWIGGGFNRGEGCGVMVCFVVWGVMI